MCFAIKMNPNRTEPGAGSSNKRHKNIPDFLGLIRSGLLKAIWHHNSLFHLNIPECEVLCMKGYTKAVG